MTLSYSESQLLQSLEVHISVVVFAVMSSQNELLNVLCCVTLQSAIYKGKALIFLFTYTFVHKIIFVHVM